MDDLPVLFPRLPELTTTVTDRVYEENLSWVECQTDQVGSQEAPNTTEDGVEHLQSDSPLVKRDQTYYTLFSPGLRQTQIPIERLICYQHMGDGCNTVFLFQVDTQYIVSIRKAGSLEAVRRILLRQIRENRGMVPVAIWLGVGDHRATMQKYNSYAASNLTGVREFQLREDQSIQSISADLTDLFNQRSNLGKRRGCSENQPVPKRARSGEAQLLSDWTTDPLCCRLFCQTTDSTEIAPRYYYHTGSGVTSCLYLMRKELVNRGRRIQTYKFYRRARFSTRDISRIRDQLENRDNGSLVAFWHGVEDTTGAHQYTDRYFCLDRRNLKYRPLVDITEEEMIGEITAYVSKQ